MNFSKNRVIAVFEEMLLSKKELLETELTKIREDATLETKSSMGDKYETNREMLRQEEKKLLDQKLIFEDQLLALKRLAPTRSMDRVGAGSLVKTNAGLFFVGVGLGEAKVGEETVFGISTLAPLAQQLLGKREGEAIKLNAGNYQILKID